MKPKKFFNSFRDGFFVLLKKPILLFLSLVLWVFFEAISFSGRILAPNLQTTWANIAWTISAGALVFLAGAYILTGMIGIVLKNKNAHVKTFFQSSNKFWFRGFLIILLITLVGFLIERLAYYGAFFIGRILSLTVSFASALFILIYLTGLALTIFLTFSQFMLVKKNTSFLKAIGDSVKFVKKEYPAALSFSFIFFILFYLASKVHGIFGDALVFLILLPYFVAVGTKFVEEK